MQKTILLMASSTVAAMAMSSALAQEDEIVVTATKREQTLQDVPVAVSVVSADTIEKAQVNDLFDLQFSVPSLRIEQLQNSAATNFEIRGFGNGANNPGVENSVGVFVDGVFRSRSAASILDLPTLERVEVLRGPQSTLFGKNVSVGAISITTKKPDFEWGGSAEATYGNFNRVIFKGTLTGPITDSLAFRVSGSTQNRDGYYTNIVDGSDINERDRWSVRGQLLWEPNDVLSVRAIGDYNKIDEACCGAVQILNSPASLAITAPPPFGLGEELVSDQDPFSGNVAVDVAPRNRLIGRGGSLHADWELGFATLTSITSYREQENSSNTDGDFSGAAIVTNPQVLNYETFTQEIRLTSDGDGPLSWLVGGFYFNEDVRHITNFINGEDTRPFFDLLLRGVGQSLGAIEGASQLAFALTTSPATGIFPELGPLQSIPSGGAFAAGSGFFGDFTLDDESYSFFANADYELTDRLTLSAGVSYLKSNKFATGSLTLTDPTSGFDLIAGGQSFVAASVLGTLIPGALGGPVAFNPANPGPFFAAVAQFSAAAPAGFEMARLGALAFATDPANAGSNPLTPLSGIQFFGPQVNFPDPTNPLDNGRLDDDSVDYQARLSYQVTDAVNTYFGYSTGFKVGAINLSSGSQPPDPVTGLGRSIEPEDVELLELGLKANFVGGYINIALFQQTVEGFQSNPFTGTGFVLSNAGEQRTRGFEFESLYSPIDPLTLTFGLTYLDPQFISFVRAACVPQDVVNCSAGEDFRDLSGTRVGGVHSVSLSTSALYEFTLNSSFDGFARAEYFFESDAPINNSLPGGPTREVNILNATIGLQHSSGFEVNVWARNLTDDAYFIEDFPSVQPGALSGYVNEPRTYGVTLRKKF